MGLPPEAGWAEELSGGQSHERQIEVLIVDDDPFASELLRRLLTRKPDMRVVGEVRSVAEGVAALARNNYDVVFLDVHLIGGSGFDLVPHVRADAGIIFVTGRDDWAVRAFEVNALDYLVKPVTAERLAESLRRVYSTRRAERVTPRRFKVEDSIFLRGAAAGGRFIPLDQIVAVFSAENYSKVLLEDGEQWLVRRTMRQWDMLLPAATFLRVHRTAIVNVQRVERIERNRKENTCVRLRGMREPTPVARRVWTRLKTRLERHGK